jgi:hypothetical protein
VNLSRHRLVAATACLAALGAVSGCAADRDAGAAPVAAVAPASSSCIPGLERAPLVPDDGVLGGVNLDWEADTLASYAERLGRTPAVVVSFAAMPLSNEAEKHIDAAVAQAAEAGAALMLTVEPVQGLASVTQEVADDLAHDLRRWNDSGVPVYLRFAHEMNGSWYAWGQQPSAYVRTFRTVARAVHATAPRTAMVWAPNYGGGYPFPGGAYEVDAGTTDAALLDTDGDGRLTMADDAYAPYYPGDDHVDWAGLSLYHWGAAYPWGENEVPEPGKLEAMLTGTYRGTVGDEQAVTDFAQVYGTQHGRPLALTETAAFFAPDAGGSPVVVKAAWAAQVYDDALHERVPSLRMINWFEWVKHEAEVDAQVDWTATLDPAVRSAHLDTLPDWLRSAGDC